GHPRGVRRLTAVSRCFVVSCLLLYCLLGRHGNCIDASGSLIQGVVMSATATHLPQEPAPPHPDRHQLQQAYDLFGRMSEQLRESQSLLEQQVAQLKAELAEVSAQRTRELAEKACLAGRLQN